MDSIDVLFIPLLNAFNNEISNSANISFLENIDIFLKSGERGSSCKETSDRDVDSKICDSFSKEFVAHVHSGERVIYEEFTAH